jgi:putative membrane protein
MTNPEKSKEGKTFSANELSRIRTSLASNRTLMAADRTLMAWVRTALSMISFGFTIYKVLQGFQASGVVLLNENLPRNMGLFLIGMGTFAIVFGTIEYWHTIKELRHLLPVRLARPSFIIAVVMSLLGTLMFFSIITRLL